eukprot:scaffold159836_cov23-Tisochrysis_lutea.AAC.1
MCTTSPVASHQPRGPSGLQCAWSTPRLVYRCRRSTKQREVHVASTTRSPVGASSSLSGGDGGGIARSAQHRAWSDSPTCEQRAGAALRAARDAPWLTWPTTLSPVRHNELVHTRIESASAHASFAAASVTRFSSLFWERAAGGGGGGGDGNGGGDGGGEGGAGGGGELGLGGGKAGGGGLGAQASHVPRRVTFVAPPIAQSRIHPAVHLPSAEASLAGPGQRVTRNLVQSRAR